MADASVENHVNSDNLAALADNVNVVLPPKMWQCLQPAMTASTSVK